MSRPSGPTPHLSPSPGKKREKEYFQPPKKIDERFKKNLLRGAFDENLDLLRDQPLGTTRRKREKKWKKLRKWIFGSTGILGLAVGIVLLTGLALGRSRAEVPAQAPAAQSFRVLNGNDPDTPASPRALSMMSDAIPLGVHRVAIDPGHGGIDGGTSINYGMVEKDLTLDIALRLKTLMENEGLSIVMTRKTDEAVSLAERARIANEAKADLFVSIHVNWLPKRNARGFETYYLGASADPFLNRLAQQENMHSGYTLADSRRLLDAIYSDSRRKSSKGLAQQIQQSLYRVLSKANPGVISRGVMKAPFVVLVATEMPAVLAEVACLSNDREARQLAIPSYRQNIALGLARGILSFAENSAKPQKEHLHE